MKTEMANFPGKFLQEHCCRLKTGHLQNSTEFLLFVFIPLVACSHSRGFQ